MGSDSVRQEQESGTQGKYLEQLEPFVSKMRQSKLPEQAIRLFCHYYRQLREGAAGFVPGAEAQPVDVVPALYGLDQAYATAGRKQLDRVVLWKLNGGLGTSMGMHGPKSVLPAKGGLTFLDIILRQVLHQRRSTGARLPLVLMDSFHSQHASKTLLDDYPEFTQDIPSRFLQHRVPKVWVHSLSPAVWPRDPEMEWCPPGHGGIYASLAMDGLLDEMLAAGYEYAFVSNADNLGAVVEPRILGYLAERGLPFLMEVTLRTCADSKGGHLARRPDGRLMLRELSQCPPDEQPLFYDTETYRYFNTNNLWLHLPTLRRVLAERDGMLELPLIRNVKPIDPADPSSPAVYHLETAIGAAIAAFPEAEALLVPRSRFVPVKKTNDLLLLWSDAYQLAPGYRIELASRQTGFQSSLPPNVELDERYFRTVREITLRFPFGAPSLRQCRELKVTGNVYFGRNVILLGRVHVINERETPFWIPDGAVLTGEVRRPAPRPHRLDRGAEERAKASGSEYLLPPTS
ncbi:MAG TPA: UTP--glucose-1-phosphate uridylyltransferase [Caldilineaceae bacterium]|nr:UTP--glucose-1-phosphate uridylyltransferase [Caldilineaceae bacterium]